MCHVRKNKNLWKCSRFYVIMLVFEIKILSKRCFFFFQYYRVEKYVETIELDFHTGHHKHWQHFSLLFNINSPWHPNHRMDFVQSIFGHKTNDQIPHGNIEMDFMNNTIKSKSKWNALFSGNSWKFKFNNILFRLMKTTMIPTVLFKLYKYPLDL